MEMGDIKFKRDAFTWANNREGKGYTHERLDGFFGLAGWIMHFDKTKVKHIFKHASDHYLLLLVSNPLRKKQKQDSSLNLDGQKCKSVKT